MQVFWEAVWASRGDQSPHVPPLQKCQSSIHWYVYYFKYSILFVWIFFFYQNGLFSIFIITLKCRYIRKYFYDCVYVAVLHHFAPSFDGAKYFKLQESTNTNENYFERKLFPICFLMLADIMKRNRDRCVGGVVSVLEPEYCQLHQNSFHNDVGNFSVLTYIQNICC